MSEPLIVTFEHLRTVPGMKRGAGYCSGKSRDWFARHNLDWLDFVRNGIDAEILLATGCALAARLVEHARRVEGRGDE